MTGLATVSAPPWLFTRAERTGPSSMRRLDNLNVWLSRGAHGGNVGLVHSPPVGFGIRWWPRPVGRGGPAVSLPSGAG